MNIASALVGIKRRLYVALRTDLGKHFSQQTGSFFQLRRARCVEIIQPFQTSELLFDDLVSERQIQRITVQDAIQLYSIHGTQRRCIASRTS